MVNEAAKVHFANDFCGGNAHHYGSTMTVEACVATLMQWWLLDRGICSEKYISAVVPSHQRSPLFRLV